eukprot:jgi/Chrzof1/13952/Cz08g19060.t1
MSEPCLMTSSPAGHHTTRGCLPLGQGGAKLLWTHTNKVTDGWRLIAAIQHDNRGQPTFFHRTLNEFQWGGEPYPTEVVAGPLPLRWIQYYLASDSHGVSKAVGDEHVVPDIAFSLLQECPGLRFMELRQLRLPIDRQQDLEMKCLCLWWQGSEDVGSGRGRRHKGDTIHSRQTGFSGLMAGGNTNSCLPLRRIALYRH